MKEYVTKDQANQIREAVRNGQKIDLSEGVIKVIRYDILYRYALNSGQLKLEDLQNISEGRWANNEEFVAQYLPFLNLGLADWLSGHMRYAMDEFLDQDIKPNSKFIQSNVFPYLRRLASKIREIYPDGRLSGEESQKVCRVIKATLAEKKQ